MIVANARRIQRRVREISDAVKGVTSPPHFAPCRIASVLDGVFGTLQTYAAERGITLEVEGLDTLPVIEADEHRLFNAFYNLISNAVPEVPEGGEISVSGKEENPGVEILITVSDNGRGMRPEVRDRLFSERAITTKQEGRGWDQNCQRCGRRARRTYFCGKRGWRGHHLLYTSSCSASSLPRVNLSQTPELPTQS